VPSAEVCDGKDNDCDGQVDEEIASVPTTCGIGACGATGQSTCVNGQMTDTCTPGTPGTEGPVGNATCSDQIDNDCDGATDASDSGCMARQLPDMSQWLGTWFKVKLKTNCSTFIESAALFVKEKNTDTGYMNIWKWDSNSGELHFDYYEDDTGVWNAFTDTLHFFAGTDMQFLFWYGSYDDTMESTLTGEIKGKVKNGILKNASIKTLGGILMEVQNDNNQYSACEQIMEGNMLNESKVPVPLGARLSH
jgi:hypothetical protein